MFRTILRNQQIRRTIEFNRYLSIESIGSIKFNRDETKNITSKFKRSISSTSTDNSIRKSSISDHLSHKSTQSNHKSTQSNHKSTQSNQNQELDRFFQDVMNCKNIESLFEFIKPKLNSLDTDQLKFIYMAINSFINRSTFDTNVSLIKFNESIKKSAIFNRLLNRSNDLIKELDLNCLKTIFRTFSLLNYDSQSQIVKNCILELDHQSTVFNLNDIANCLKIVSFYLARSTLIETELWELNKKLIDLARLKILNNEFDQTDISSIEVCVLIFLKNSENDPNRDVINYLIEFLISPDVQLNFKQSTNLLKTIKQSHSFFKKQKLQYLHSEELLQTYRRRDFYPKSLSKLIDKCNLKIFETFSSEPTENELSTYLLKLHQTIDTLNYELRNFYDQRLLDFLTSFLLNKFKYSALDYKTKEILFNLNFNYSRFNVYDERLLKLLYEIVCTDKKFRMHQSTSHIYLIFSELRLPFVDHQYLATKLLFETPTNSYESRDKFKTDLIFLKKLILNDIKDEKIFNHLNESIGKLTKKDYVSISKNELPEIILSNICLTLFNEMDDILKLKIVHKLNEIIYELSKNKKNNSINYDYFNIDTKLQRNGYLSNGLLINAFSIYDKSTNDLLPLDKFKSYFKKIDKISQRLNKNQELITSVGSFRLKGNIENYDEIYNYQLKNVLNHYNIETIDVFKDDFVDLNIEDQVQFFKNNFLDHFKNVNCTI